MSSVHLNNQQPILFGSNLPVYPDSTQPEGPLSRLWNFFTWLVSLPFSYFATTVAAPVGSEASRQIQQEIKDHTVHIKKSPAGKQSLQETPRTQKEETIQRTARLGEKVIGNNHSSLESSAIRDWSSLPVTALEKIVDNLSDEELLHMAGVCKEWQHFIENDPKTAQRYFGLLLDKKIEKVKNLAWEFRELQELTQEMKELIKEADKAPMSEEKVMLYTKRHELLSRLVKLSERFAVKKQNLAHEFQEFAENNINKLKCLDLSGLSFGEMVFVLSNLPDQLDTIETIDFRTKGLPREFNYDPKNPNSEEMSVLLISICKKCPNLKHIYLPESGKNILGEKAYQLVPTSSTYLKMAKLCPKLQFDQIILIDSLSDDNILKGLKDHLKEVRSIVSYYGINYSNETLKMLAKQCPNLQELMLSASENMPIVTGDGIRQILLNCKELQKLTLEGPQEIKDVFFEGLSVPVNLKTLSLGIREYGNYTHNFLIKAMPQMKIIDLRDRGMSPHHPSINGQYFKELIEANPKCIVNVLMTEAEYHSLPDGCGLSLENIADNLVFVIGNW